MYKQETKITCDSITRTSSLLVCFYYYLESYYAGNLAFGIQVITFKNFVEIIFLSHFTFFKNAQI